MDKTVRLRQLEDGWLLHTLNTGSTEKVVFAPDSLTLASASDRGVQVWRTEDGVLLHIFKGHNSYLRDIAYSPDSAILASADDYGVVQLWDVNRGVRIRTLRQNWGLLGAHAVAFSPDGKILATAQRYGPVWLYDVQQLLGRGTN
jgi:WD40 repeat protein